MTRMRHAKVKAPPEPTAPSLVDLLGPDPEQPARVLSLSELDQAAREIRDRRPRGPSEQLPVPWSEPSVSRILAPLRVGNDAEISYREGLMRRIRSSLGPDPSAEEITEAAKVAFWALPDKERQSTSVEQLRRRLA